MTLKSTGYKITERTAGIYDITGNLPFPLQVIVTRLLAPEHHSSLRILSKHAKKEDIEQFLMETEHYTTPGEKIMSVRCCRSVQKQITIYTAKSGGNQK